MKEGGQPNNTNAQKYTEEDLLKIGNDLLKWMEHPANFFFEKFLLSEYDLYNSFLARYVKKSESFAKLIGKAKKKQELKLAKAGMMGDTNPAMTKFVLSNNHGWSDKAETKNDTSISGGVNVTVNKTILGSES